jgi:uncharacterized membrane protein YdjX (TVP38/TMEM64 family)
LDTSSSDQHPAKGSPVRWKLLALLVGVAIVAVGYWQLRDVLTLEYLAAQEATLRRWQEDRPLVVFLIALLIYTVVAGLSVPVATGMTVVCGWYFGFWVGLVVASFGSTAGATIAFLISRYLFHDWAQSKVAGRIKPINEAFERDGAFYVFAVRLLPVVAPYFIVNVVLGLTRVRAVTFWWASQLGMLPTTAIYVYAGSTVPTMTKLAEQGVRSLMNWQLVLALTLLAIFPLATKIALDRMGIVSRRK